MGSEPVTLNFATGSKPNDSEKQRSARCQDFTAIVEMGIAGRIDTVAEATENQRGYHFFCGLFPHPTIVESPKFAHHMFVYTEENIELVLSSDVCKLLEKGRAAHIFEQQIAFIAASSCAPQPEPVNITRLDKRGGFF